MNKFKRVICLLITYILIVANIPVTVFANELNEEQAKIKAMFEESEERYYVRTAQQYKDKTYIEIYERGNYETPNTYIIDENNKKQDIDSFEENGTINLDGNILKMDSHISAIEDSSYWDYNDNLITPDLVEINMDNNTVKKEAPNKQVVDIIRANISNKYKNEKIDEIYLSDMDILGQWVYYSVETEKGSIIGVYKDENTIIEIDKYILRGYSFKEWGELHEDVDGSVYVLYQNRDNGTNTLSVVKNNKLQQYSLEGLSSDTSDFYVSKSGEYIICTEHYWIDDLYKIPTKIYKFDESSNTYKEYGQEIFKSGDSILASDVDINNNIWFLIKSDGKVYIKMFSNGKLTTKYRFNKSIEQAQLNVYDEKNLVVYSWDTSDYPYQRIVDGRFIDENHTSNDGDDSGNEQDYSIQYQSHVSHLGWQEWKKDGELSGTEGQSKKLEAIKIKLGSELPQGASVEYRTHVSYVGWQDWKKDGELSGTEGQSKNLEAIEIRLKNAPGYSVEYRTHISHMGWQDWKKDGELSGTEGQTKNLEAIEIKIVKKEDPSIKGTVNYQSHVSQIGWQDWKRDGNLSGTEGQSKQLEAIRIKLGKELPEGASIEYRTHISQIGWQDWKRDGDLSGTEAQSKNLEAIEIRLKNAPGYSVEYRTHVSQIGWQDWRRDGDLSGTEGQSKSLEAIEIKIVEVPMPDVQYRTHVQDYGWQNWVSNGVMSGTNGESKRLEGIEIKLANAPKGSKILYQTHIQDYGWQEWKSEGEMAGTNGESKRLEGIEVRVVK